MADVNDLDFGATIRGFSAGNIVFQRYTLTRVLGRGGMGIVWLARDRELDRDIALKFLPEVVMTDQGALEDLRREARRSIDLRHMHIVAIHNFERDERAAAISMELVDGDTLANLRVAKPARVFSAAELMPVLTGLASALEYAHEEAKVVHRDIKPANLMLDKRGRLKVTDFGIARSITDSVSRVSRAATGDGSLPYMSPQQLGGEDPAVTDDIYAVGATLYELLTTKPPFYSGGMAAVMHQIQNKVPPSVADRRKQLQIDAEPVPAEWEELIAACLAKDPAARPQRAAELPGRLQPPAKPAAPVAPTPVAVLAAPAPEPAGEELKRIPGKGIVAIAAMIAAAAAVYYFSVVVPAEEKARVEQQARADAGRRAADDERARQVGDRRQADAEKLAADRTAAERRAHDAVLAKITALPTTASATETAALGREVDAYEKSAPERFQGIARQRWDLRQENVKLEQVRLAEQQRLAAEGEAEAKKKAAVAGTVPKTTSTPATTSTTTSFAPGQLVKEFGWFVGKKTGLVELGFNRSEIVFLVKGFRAAATQADSPYDLDKIGPTMDAFIAERQKIHEAKTKPGSAATKSAAAAASIGSFSESQLIEEFGWFVGKRVGLSELEFSPEEINFFIAGLEVSGAGADSPFDLEKIGPEIDAFIQAKQGAYLQKLKSKSQRENAAFFAKLAENKNIVRLSSGLCYQILTEGTGVRPNETDTVKVHYHGTLIDGAVFDSSVQRGEPMEFPLKDVIPGWTEGMQKVRRGGKIKLYVPPHLAYGDDGRPGIPPVSTLVFEVELLDVKPTPAK